MTLLFPSVNTERIKKTPRKNKEIHTLLASMEIGSKKMETKRFIC